MVDAARVTPGSWADLVGTYDPERHDPELAKDSGEAALAQAKVVFEELQDRFFAQADRAMLIVLQAIDAAGKDSAIKHVMSGLNPQGVDVYSFKAPTPTELAHDYLWRHQRVLPERGRIAVFNRSHYENVLVTRVHPDQLHPPVPSGDLKALWRRRFEEINSWERYLHETGTVIVKLFLNVSKREQKVRFLQRLDNPEKNWKFSVDDLKERAFWDQYQEAFTDMLSHTSTERAPWYVVPADHKWFAHLTISAILVDTLSSLGPRYPELTGVAKAALARAKSELLAESD